MENENTCTCGRYIGMSESEKYHLIIDDFLGIKTKYVPKTKEEIEKQKLEYELQQAELLQKQKDYLITHNIETNNLTTDEIFLAYNKCLYYNMSDDEKKNRGNITLLNYNILRIFRGWEAVAYSDQQKKITKNKKK